ncbi:hypothetical protein [Hyphobacterium sp.]|uniref:hypothetical protein n=1 Tax=Hyphobacterium sp. TaxID=2004662 RepID=UPI003B515598
MKIATTGLVLAMILPTTAAMAQVTDLTGSVQNQTRGSLSSTTSQTTQGIVDQRSGIDSRLDQQTDLDSRLDQQTDLDSRLDQQTDIDSRLDQQTDIDSRLDSGVNTDLGVDDTVNAQTDATLDAQTRMRQTLQTSLTAYDRSNASARLASQLEQRSQMYAGGSVSADAPDSASAYTGAAASSHAGGSGHVAVYSSDGYRIGTVARYDADTNGQVHFDRSGINTEGVVAVSESDAMFDADAQAIVLNATRADVSGMASVG